ncbi:TFIIB-type zinc ribbon-containing protein [Roseicyclus sp.]|jgi:Zn-finger nucleic acid-binding protein
MQCPIDGTTLVMADRQGVEIDYCPQCRGVWLDRGELDKIIERSAPQGRAGAPDAEPYPQTHHVAPKRKRRGSFLDDIFDF